MATQLIRKWKRIDESKCELEGPYECPNCGGHMMIDATYLDQVDTDIVCPYCLEMAVVKRAYNRRR